MKATSGLRPSALLTAATAGLWLLSAWPAWSLAGRTGLEGLTLAAGLCLVPGWLAFFLSARYRVAKSQVQVVLLATTMRMLFVAVGTLAARQLRPDLRLREFLVWVIVFYLATLAIETALLLKQPSSSTPPPDE